MSKSILELAREGRGLEGEVGGLPWIYVEEDLTRQEETYLVFAANHFPALAQALEEALSLLQMASDGRADDEIATYLRSRIVPVNAIRAFLARVAPERATEGGE